MAIDLTPAAWLFLIALMLFFVFRFVSLWYWRINEIVNLLKKNNELLEKLIARQDRQIDIMETPLDINVESTAKKRNPGALDRLAKKMAP